jgi:hypothetical protein
VHHEKETNTKSVPLIDAGTICWSSCGKRDARDNASFVFGFGEGKKREEGEGAPQLSIGTVQ